MFTVLKFGVYCSLFEIPLLYKSRKQKNKEPKTKEQKTENKPMSLTIYKSSAGSGKTFTLVKEYLKIVLKDPNEYQHILAITFTNKATEEMKTRIIEDLTDLAKGEKREKDDMFNALMEEESWKMSAKEIKENAWKTLQRILHNYARFEVRTIDSFFTRIVRSFAKELNLPMRYSIDLDQRKALREAMDLFYNDIHNNPDIEGWLEAFANKKLSDDKGWRTDFNIRKMGEQLFNEKFYEFGQNEAFNDLKELRKEIQAMEQSNQKVDKNMKGIANKAMALLKKNNLTTKDFKRGAVTYFSSEIPKKNYTKANATFRKICEGEGSWCAKKSLKLVEIEAISEQLVDLGQAALIYFEEQKTNYLNNREVLKNIYSYGVMSQLAAALKEYRDNENILLLSDTNALMRDAIKDQDAPFLLEKVGSKYKHILVDEFQDTSSFQWHNLRPLVKNSLGENHEVLIVGDVKQSLYRWRGGNMKLLLTQVEADLLEHKETTKVDDLKRNFRSFKNIVEFNNAFLGESKISLSGALDELEIPSEVLNKSYENFRQETTTEEKGYVQVQFLEKVGRSDDLYKEATNEAIIETIRKAHADGYGYSEILILVRQHSDSVAMATMFTERNIPFLTEQSLLLKNSAVIQLILSILQYLKNEFDPISQSTLLYRYCKYNDIPIDDFHEVFRKAEDGEINQQLIENLPVEFMSKLAHIRRKPLVEILEDLLFIFKLNTQPSQYLQRLQDVALDLSVKKIIGLKDFFDWWDEKSDKLSIQSAAGQESVQIMTIHKAKGLERSVVIVPFADYSFAPKGLIWVDELEEGFKHFGMLPITINKDLSETDFADSYKQELIDAMVDTLNVVYVAFTRPKERLYVFAKHMASIEKDLNSVNKLLWRFANNLGDNLPKDFKPDWSPDEWCLKIGEEVKKVQKEETKTKQVVNTEELKSYQNRPYKDRVGIRSESERYFEILDLEKIAKISTGIKIHAVLENLERKEDLEEVVDQLVRDRVLQEEDKQDIINQISALLERDLFKYFFKEDWEVYTERSIFWNGQMYKPDRVIVKNNEAIVVDYKKEIRNEKYQKQIRGYGYVLKQLGYTNVRLYLVYVQTGAIDEYILGGDERWRKYQEEYLEFVPEIEQLLEE